MNRMEDNKLRVLTVRVNDDNEREAIRYVMRQSGCKRAAHAMLFACKAYQIINERENPVIKDLNEKHRQHSRLQQRLINSLMQENERLRKCITQMHGTVVQFQKSMTEIQDIMSKK